MFKSFIRCSMLLASISLVAGCSAYQPTKNVWKGTKDFWNTYVSVPAKVDYEEKGDLSPRALALTNGMMGIDMELSRLERALSNADKSPSSEWINNFLSSFPWLTGVAGVKADGTLLGREPAVALKELDFIPLLYEDKKQSSRALRADVQNTPLGPEVMLASPLYDGVDFLGVLVAHFDMRNVITFSGNPSDIVVLSPYALLWPGKYDFAATPLAGLDWTEIVSKSSSGTCENARGTFYYMVRFLGNTPLVFAVAESGDFPQGNGSLEQGLPFFPKEREKLPVPPQPERKNRPDMGNAPSFGTPANAEGGQAGTQGNEVQPGSHESMLLREDAPSRPGVQERQLEGENVEMPKPRQRRKPAPRPAPVVDLIPDEDAPSLGGGRPSPFGPRESVKRPSPFGPKDAAKEPATSTTEPAASSDAAAPAAAAPAQEQKAEPVTSAQEQKEAPAAPAAERAKPAEVKPAAEGTAPKAAEQDADRPEGPALLPGGRPSPFGPRE